MPVSFFAKTTAKHLWKSVVSVSNAGSKRGRGRGLGRIIAKDFNRGQYIGEGRNRITLPGLNAPIISGLKSRQIEEVGENTKFSESLKAARERQNVFRKYTIHPMDRGWSGRKSHGRKAGPPNDYDGEPLEGFESTVISSRGELVMTKLGRVKIFHSIVVTGNGKGLAGFDQVESKDIVSGITLARNRAGRSLISIPLWQNHTIMHDFYSKYLSTTVFAFRKPKGHGVKGSRVIKAICEAFGIKDILVEIDGNRNNVANLTKAFFLGLMNQRTYESMAEEKQLHLVDVREENFYYPEVLASPKSRLKTEQEINIKNEDLNFTYYIYDGKIRSVLPKFPSRFLHEPSWQTHLDRIDRCKNREDVRLKLAARYGNTRVLDVFPLFKTTAASFKEEDKGDT